MPNAFPQKLGASRKFGSDVAWNLASLAAMGLAGIAVNLLVARFYSAATLGVFNQVFAIYLILSQVVAGGIHLSVLTSISRFPEDSAGHSVVVGSALLATVLIASCSVFACFAVKDPVGRLLDSKGVSTGMTWLLPGLFLLPLNKVLLSFHNGCSRMKACAVFQALRSLFLIASLMVFVQLALPGDRLPVVLSVSELLLFLCLLAYSLRFFSFTPGRAVLRGVKSHLRFGSQAVLGNLLADANTRVDILVLGIYCPDAVVGIYSFAAMFVDGYNQLAVVVRNCLNPLITHSGFHGGDREMSELLHRCRAAAYKFFIPVGLLLTASLPALVFLVGLDGAYYGAAWIVAVLMAGSLIASGYLPLQMVFNQSGLPFLQTVYYALVFVTNLALNLALVPALGYRGAAVATSLAAVSQVLYLQWLALRGMRIRI